MEILLPRFAKNQYVVNRPMGNFQTEILATDPDAETDEVQRGLPPQPKVGEAQNSRYGGAAGSP